MPSRSRPALEINVHLLRRGAVLLGVGGSLVLIGAGLSGAAVFDAARRWVQQLDESPSAMARRRWAQGRTAILAGADAWRHNGDIVRERSLDPAAYSS